MACRCTGRVPKPAFRVLVERGSASTFANDSLQYGESVMTPRGHITEARVAELAERLTPAERAVLETLDRMRVATTSQLERLHFTGAGSRRTRARRCRRTLARLVELRVLARLDRRIGGAVAGSSEYPYALDVAGQRLASVCGPAGGVRIRRPWTPGAPFLLHSLEVTGLYVWLVEADRRGDLDLIAFDAEPLCWRTFSGLGGARVVLKPDAFVRLGVGSYEHFFFVEVDRATQSGPSVGRKLTTYRRYWQTGREQARFGLFPKVLVLVPSETRRGALVDVASEQPAEAAPLFQTALYADALAVFTERGAA